MSNNNFFLTYRQINAINKISFRVGFEMAAEINKLQSNFTYSLKNRTYLQVQLELFSFWT